MELSKGTWHYRNWEYWLEHGAFRSTKRFRETEERRHVWNEQLQFHDYKLVTIPPQSVSLCTYFWIAVLRAPFWRVIKWSGANPAISIPAWFLIAVGIIGTLVNHFDSNISAWWHPYAILIGWAVGFVISGAAIIALCVGWSEYGGPWLKEKYYLRRQRDRPEVGEKQPNIFVETVKAKKSKVCPILHFTDPENNDDEQTPTPVA